jgi:ABC-type branched-subunit amino acid transport system substrate-binding protein
VSLKRKLLWLPLVVALIAVPLLVVACGGGGNENAGTAPNIGPTLTAESSDRTGVTDTEIKLGTHFPLSQNPAAAYAPIAYGMKAFFDYIDAQGGVYGRKINFIIGDDHYNPPDTVEVVKSLVEQDKVFAVVGGLGEETHAAVWKYLEQNGVPDMFVSTGLAKWTHPIVRTRFGGNPDYVSEGTFLGQYIAKTYPNAKVGLLLQSDEMGQDGETGLRAGFEGSNVQIIDTELYDVTQSDVTAQTQRLKNAGADVVAVYAIPPQAASLVRAARETLNWDVPIVVSGINCSDIFIALAGAKDAEGVVSFTFGHQAYETELPGVQKYEKIWDKFANGTTGPLSNFELYGMFVAELTVDILERTGQDLSRGSFLDAAESTCKFMCTTCPGFGPVSLSPTDHQPTQVFVINVVKGGNWVASGDPVDFETTKDCTPKPLPADYDKQPKVGADADYVATP